MILGSDGVSSWATRFGIITPGGKLEAEPKSTQPNGDKIPWGVGKIVGASAATDNSTASASASASSAPVVAAAVSSVAPVVESAIASATSAIAAAVTPASSPAASVAQVAPAHTNSGSMIKPALTLVSAAVAGYFAL